MPGPHLKSHHFRCLARRRWCVREDGRTLKSTLAEKGIYLFLILTVIAVPAFGVAQIALVEFQSSRTATIAGCLLTALIIVLLLNLDSEGKIRPLPTRGLMIAVAIVSALVGFGALALPLVQDEQYEVKSPLRKGTDITVEWPPFRLAEAPGGVIWAGEKDGLIHSVDTSLRQPVGTTIRVGRVLHDVAFFRRFVFATVDDGKVVRIDPDPTGAAPLTRKFGEDGGDVVGDERSLFVNDRSQAVVFRLSFNLTLLKRILVNANPKARATAIALGGDGFLWVIDAGLNAIYKISLEDNEVVTSKTIPQGPAELLVVDKTVYIAHPNLGFIEKRDGRNAELLPGRISIEPGPTHMTTAEGLLVIGSSKTGTVAAVSLDTGKPVGSALVVGAMPTDLDFGPQSDKQGWVARGDGGGLVPVTVRPKADWPKACPCSALP